VRKVVLLVAVLGAAVLAQSAYASQLIDRNATGVKLSIDTKGEALITYTSGGKLKHVLAWGAVNALPPTAGKTQVAFKLDYAGGWGKYHTEYWKTFKGTCGAYDGPALHWLVKACKAPDGSYWALQAWQRALPDYGVTPTAAQSVVELHLSHWTGPIAEFTINTDWAWHQWDHLWGTLIYDGKPVYGFKASPSGQPLDSWGRNVYLDTYDSVYGSGWRRENSFLVHNPTGAFCYSVNPHGSHPSGKGTMYRATVIGPGVTPDLYWQGNSPGPYDAAADATANAAIAALGDKLCKPN
jgi:hypothetical protein